MKLPSINYLLSSAKDSFLRFPLTIILSLISATLGIYLAEYRVEITNMFPYINLMLCTSLAIPLYFCITIISNKAGYDKKALILLNLLATLILVGLYFTFPNSDSTHNTSLPYIKYALYNITCHLLVSFAPFALSMQLNAFWHFNKILFIRFLLSGLYSGFIYLGLIIALTSLNLLFDVKIHEMLYFDIWIVVVFFFNTWFFVSSIPSDFNRLEEIDEYPKGLKTFSQYILLPLLALYLTILYAYGTKILALWDWPRGIVSYLIICVTVLGILSFLLLHPYGNQEENRWVKKASRWYYFLLFPLLVLLFIAIFMRVGDYGITINRYVIIILAIWLTVVCVYTAIGKSNIKFIPTSLAVILILISFGPWGMFSYSQHSQVKRLKTILEQATVLVDSKVSNESLWAKDSLPNLYLVNALKNDALLNDSLHNEVKSILDYLDNHHGFASIREWFKQDIDSLIESNFMYKNRSPYYKEAEVYMMSFGLDYDYNYSEHKVNDLNFKSATNQSVKTISGYDYLVCFNQYFYRDGSKNITSFTLDSIVYDLDYTTNPTLNLTLKSTNETVNLDLNSLIKALEKEYGKSPENDLPISKMQLKGATKEFDFKLEFHYINITKENNDTIISNLSGDIFLKRR